VWCVRAAIVAVASLSTTSLALGAGQGYREHDLVSDVEGRATRTDPQLVNPWGMVIDDGGDIWISNAGSHTATVYRVSGAPARDHGSRVVVQIPANAAGEDSGPTGVVDNESDAFVISSGGASGPAEYIFANLDGTIDAWSGDVDATNAVVAADRSAAGAVYTGLAISDEASGNFLFAANFAARTIDVFGGDFHFVRSFTDPNMEAGYSPFNLKAIGNQLFVAYAKVGDDGDEEKGVGLGIVDVFDFAGGFVKRFASHGTLNAPWGFAVAPRNFGELSNMLLVGNFGDGRINAYDPTTGAFAGQLADRSGAPVEIEGLWSIEFGPSRKSNVLFFTAGIEDEEHGLFGALNKQQGR